MPKNTLSPNTSSLKRGSLTRSGMVVNSLKFDVVSSSRKKLTDTYKLMLADAWSGDEERHVRSSSRVSSQHTFGNPGYELVVRTKNEDLPIVGYAPIFAEKLSPSHHRGKVRRKASETLVTEQEVPPQSAASSSGEPFAHLSSQMFEVLKEELEGQAYVEPFDKFVPHEKQLPDLDPSVEAKLMASSELDPVRGVFEENKEKEIQNYEALLNLPTFEQFASKNENVQRKIKENINFWKTISSHEKSKPPSDQELKLLDWATLCNMYTGSWGMDEDSMMLQFFYKFQYDDSWRQRLKKGCFTLLDECKPTSCGVCKEVEDEEVAQLKPDYFFEIEDTSDYEDVVMKIKEEFNARSDVKNNWEYKQLIMNPVDSDLDSDSFVSDSELTLCADDKPSSTDWIRAKGTWVSPKGFDVRPHDEEDLPPKELKCEDIEYLRYKDIVPQQLEDPALETATLDLMKTKFEKKRSDERKGFHWRAKGNYFYKWPDFAKKKKTTQRQ